MKVEGISCGFYQDLLISGEFSTFWLLWCKFYGFPFDL